MEISVCSCVILALLFFELIESEPRRASGGNWGRSVMRQHYYAILLNTNRHRSSHSRSPTNNFGNSGNWANPSTAQIVNGLVVPPVIAYPSHDDKSMNEDDSHETSDESYDDKTKSYANSDRNDFDFWDEADDNNFKSKSIPTVPSIYGDDGLGMIY